MQDMRRKNLLFALLFALIPGVVSANWEYKGTHLGDGAYSDDGGRFIFSIRGGMAYGFGSVNNEMGALTSAYYVDADGGNFTPEFVCVKAGTCGTMSYAGAGELSELPAAKKFQSTTAIAGGSIGWAVADHPQWRLELGMDRIIKADYNASPMFDGELQLSGGVLASHGVSSASVESEITTTAITAMAYYDFFDGVIKPTHTLIPYVAFGVGYSESETSLNVSDTYGNLSDNVDLQNFGEPNSVDVLQFYESETATSNVVVVGALGLSYGMSERVFLDCGLRMMYLPGVKWKLSSEDGTRHRDLFKAKNLVYTSAMIGVRFEF